VLVDILLVCTLHEGHDRVRKGNITISCFLLCVWLYVKVGSDAFSYNFDFSES